MISFDPVIDAAGGVSQHELMDWWNDPHDLAEQYIEDMREISRGNANYQVVEWIYMNEMPRSTSGQAYDPDEYYATLVAADKATRGDYWLDDRWHDWGFTFDYDYYLTQFDVYGQVDRWEIDEVWIFAGPMVGVTLNETCMAGRNAFFINGEPIEHDCRPFVIYGFNYERGVGEMLEDAGHRAEFILSNVFGWPDYNKDYSLFNDWEKFCVYDQVKEGCAGVGEVHFAPNSERDYDWGNPRYVLSNCNDWVNYPNLTGETQSVNCQLWGNGDTRAHHKWWFSLLPHADGFNEETQKYNNWWIYFTLDYLYAG